MASQDSFKGHLLDLTAAFSRLNPHWVFKKCHAPFCNVYPEIPWQGAGGSEGLVKHFNH